MACVAKRCGRLLSCDRGAWGFLFGKQPQNSPRIAKTGRRGAIKQGFFLEKGKVEGMGMRPLQVIPGHLSKETSGQVSNVLGVTWLENAGPQTSFNNNHASNYIDNLRKIV
jgi:hypothetical protein